MEFKKFATVVNSMFKVMSSGTNPLYVVDIDRDEMYRSYLSFFEEGTNPLYIENTRHDCDTCRSFIKNIGAVVTIQGDELITVWDLPAEGIHKVVSEKMSELIRSKPIKQIFLCEFPKYGAEESFQEVTPEHAAKSRGITKVGQVLTWSHFNCVVPARFVDANRGTNIGKADSRHGVLKRGLTEIKKSAVKQVIQLIEDNVLYKGEGSDRTYLHAYCIRFIYQQQPFSIICPPDNGDVFVSNETRLQVANLATPWTLKWPNIKSTQEQHAG